MTGAPLLDDEPSFRQRLRDVEVDPRILADIAAMHGRSDRGRRAPRDAPERAMPLYKPFGGAPRFVASAKTAAS
eukprot:2020014-Prymnesium_polylepis.1